MEQDNHIMTTQEIGTIAELRISRKFLETTLRGFQFEWWIAVCYLIGGGLLGFSLAYLGPHPNTAITEMRSYTYGIIGSVVGILGYSIVAFWVRKVTLDRLKSNEKRLAEAGFIDLVDGLQDKSNFYDKLIQINFKYTDKYYQQTQEQADKSFRLATFASITSFIVLVFGIHKIYSDGGDTPSYLTTISGVLTSFVSAVFFYLYNQTIQKMAGYHKKLVLSQNINLALKIAQGIEDKAEKVTALKILIDRLTTDINKQTD